MPFETITGRMMIARVCRRDVAFVPFRAVRECKIRRPQTASGHRAPSAFDERTKILDRLPEGSMAALLGI